MAFTKKMEVIRYYGRKVVLPSDRIKRILTEEVLRDNITEGCMIDFGAGTLYWSKWFYRYIKKVIAVDVYYKNSINEDGIIFRNNLKGALEVIDERPCIIWMSDVLHHLNKKTYKEIFNELSGMDYVIIKDIDCNHRFGNFMNRMHDRIINHERIMDVDPMKLIELLEKRGFEVKKFYLPKLWYPHFLLIAKKS